MAGEISVVVSIREEFTNLDAYSPRLTLCVLDDRQDIGAYIERLREESKPVLEPLVRRYMLSSEALTRLTVRRDSPAIQKERSRLRADFSSANEDIDSILAYYRRRIDRCIEQAIIRHLAEMPVRSDAIVLRELPPGTYRVYGVISFATTTLHWFEGVTLEGGESHSIILTRTNMMNPYWTDLNWWSFMNLDFSKHHH
ncbi:hypothetical protein CSA56_03815 [candidate division KSB3 bacterium]|uniref:Uncharacterized protein n=1 Tax=candidate division KSB3 bacterium TaxID=2044937 RepID=A0A2G6KIQ1_9BACT|nr:MAG: hypothetical protein CSA56_03815 [candidate division KSB3 bacterium]